MELSKNYIPAEVEEKWYTHWLSKGYFKSTPDERKPFTIVIPPPNVTGLLHMGHTLNETVQDILVRRARMSGFNACWVPGSDHASIATEAKVVEMLKEKGIDKNSLSREEFLKYAFEWKEKYGNIIYNQIAKLGCSVDWDRVSFTMDTGYYKAVIKVFVDLYNKGLIYRGARMINWDPAAKTALSDEEVEYKEVTGKLYYIKYEASPNPSEGEASQATIPSSENTIGYDQGNLSQNTQHRTSGIVHQTSDYIIIATQRPETIMGDTAVCANPTDDRYKHLKGKSVLIPLINKKIPVIFDEYVDKEFGTGILKITPAHDINDYNIGLKHNLPIVDTLNDDGTLSEAAQIFVGEDRFTARKKIVKELKEKGYLIKEEEYQTRLGFSQRTNVVAEPKISTQWFVKMKELAEPALQAVLNSDIKIHPGEKFLATYKYWLENVKDWCISRQLWWGQQIPAWYDDDGKFVVAESKEEAEKIYHQNNGKPSISWEVSGGLIQDEDVLDTWFSSWLWPIEVFKGITQPGNDDINYYYPTSVLVTAPEIIFFWVARMIMAGFEYMNAKPFSDVYFTGIVRDKQGRKMSKSLGNSPDLLMLIDQYGADAVRFGILISSPAGNDILFDEASLEQGRNFNNKLWNALKLVKMWEVRLATVNSQQSTVNNEETGNDPGSTINKDFAVAWFENRLNEVKKELEIQNKEFKLSEALKIIYSLIWDDFCSWYLEWVKPGFEQPINEAVYNKTIEFFEALLQLLHPFMPFITEEIYHLLKEQKVDLAVKQFEELKIIELNKEEKDSIELTGISKQLIQKIRDFRNKRGIKKDKKINIYSEDFSFYEYGLNDRLKTVNAELNKKVKIIGDLNDKGKSVSLELILVKTHKFYLDLGNIEMAFHDIIRNKKQQELTQELNHLKGFLNSVDKKLNNEKFVQNAKAEVIELERKKKADAETKIRVIEESLSSLK